MSEESIENIGARGMLVHDHLGLEWVYIGHHFIKIRPFVHNWEHHFARCDCIPSTGPWLYKEINVQTIKDKFPDFKL